MVTLLVGSFLVFALLRQLATVQLKQTKTLRRHREKEKGRILLKLISLVEYPRETQQVSAHGTKIHPKFIN